MENEKSKTGDTIHCRCTNLLQALVNMLVIILISICDGDAHPKEMMVTGTVNLFTIQESYYKIIILL